MDTMSHPHQLGDLSRTVSFSIGAAMYPDDADDEQSLIKCADRAMYLAKESGRNNFKLYEREDS
jgi:diguanylate cyclase (GGDEF)-like protein